MPRPSLQPGQHAAAADHRRADLGLHRAGVLDESLAHPLTIISTLPSAGLGALIALQVAHMELSVIALIGIILLIGIVKKNGIMLVDFALEAERGRGLSPERAILEAARERFRPILMTTFAALLGAVPLALGVGPARSCAARWASPSSAACWCRRCSPSTPRRSSTCCSTECTAACGARRPPRPPPNMPLPPSDMARSVNSVALGHHCVYAAVQAASRRALTRAAGQKKVCQSLTLIRAGSEPRVYKDAGGASMRDPLRALRGTADRVS